MQVTIVSIKTEGNYIKHFWYFYKWISTNPITSMHKLYIVNCNEAHLNRFSCNQVISNYNVMYYNSIHHIPLDWFPGHIRICWWCIANLAAVCTYVTLVYSIVCCHKSTPLLKTFKKLTFRYIVYKYKVSQRTCLVCSSSSRAASAMSFSFLTAVCLSSSSWCLTSRNCSWCLTCTHGCFTWKLEQLSCVHEAQLECDHAMFVTILTYICFWYVILSK